MVGTSGLEPPTSRLSGARSNHLSYAPLWLTGFSLSISAYWWRWWDSNPWPPACRAGALPTELHPHLQRTCLHISRYPSSSFVTVIYYAFLRFPCLSENLRRICTTNLLCNQASLFRESYSDFLPVTENWTTIDSYSAKYNQNLVIVWPICDTTHPWKCVRVSIERRWSSRTFRYGYLVTT